MQSQELEAVEVNLDDIFAQSPDERTPALAGPLLRLRDHARIRRPGGGHTSQLCRDGGRPQVGCRIIPAAAALFQKSAELGTGMMVVFPPEVMKGLTDGSLRLMNTATGDAAIAVNSATGT